MGVTVCVTPDKVLSQCTYQCVHLSAREARAYDSLHGAGPHQVLSAPIPWPEGTAVCELRLVATPRAPPSGTRSRQPDTF